LKKIGDKEYITLNYNVVVLKSSSYTDLPSIKGEKVGIVNGYKEEVTNKLDKKVRVKYTSYSNYSELVDRLINKHINVILLEDSQYKILEEEYTGFENKVSVIYKFSVDVKQKTEKEKTDITKKPFNIFISGIDTYGNINSVSRSDVNMIMSINPTDKKILLTSIPRDYYVKLSGINEYDKLTHAGMYGIDTSIDTVETLLDTKINYYIKVNFSSLVKVVNTLDGIDVDSKYQFTSQDGYSFKRGINHLNGKKTLSFARERKALPDGDRSRGENHQAVLAAIINKASSKSILTNYNSLLKSLKPSLVTNLSNKELTSFIKMQIDKDIKWNITYVNLDGSDGYEYTYSYAKNKLYVMIPDEETIEYAKEEIRKILEK
jgi:LCP family protein required for cell wall assembly